jgi:hypothetical protein
MEEKYLATSTIETSFSKSQQGTIKVHILNTAVIGSQLSTKNKTSSKNRFVF